MNILTFDIEEWFHILDNPSTKTIAQWSRYERRLEANMERILGFLDDTGLKATFFCLGWVARQYPEVIRRIDALGFEVGTHSDLHQLIYEQNREGFATDLERSIKSLEDITGKKVRSFRAPGFSLKKGQKWVFEELVKQGIEIDCSIFPAHRAHGGFHDFGAAEPVKVMVEGEWIKEFPINLYPFMGRSLIFSGGGYFRLLPYAIIRRLMRKSNYVITYFHPRDFDPGQPVIGELSLVRRFKSYYGLGAAFEKLKRLTTEFTFMDLAGADAGIDWDNARQIKL